MYLTSYISTKFSGYSAQSNLPDFVPINTVYNIEFISMHVIYSFSVIVFWNLNSQLPSYTFLENINDLLVVEVNKVIQFGS